MKFKPFALGLLLLSGFLAGCGQIADSIMPTFTVQMDSASFEVFPGESATSRLTVTRKNGFNAAVSFSLEGAPKGVSFELGRVLEQRWVDEDNYIKSL